MPKLIVQLSGGLGNQMFQYATARTLALQNNLDLVIDNRSGFFRDIQYRREYELKKFPIKGRLANFHEIIPFFFIRIMIRFKKKYQLKNKIFFGQYIQEQSNTEDHSISFLQAVKKYQLNENVWIKGYWQSPYYFEKYKDLIQSELDLPKPNNDNFKSLGKKILNSKSVALGLRLYEESENPTTHSLNFKEKKIVEFNNVIEKVKKKHPKSSFFVFCTHRSKLLKKLNLPKKTTFITSEDGYTGSIEKLWLLSQCKHHIFNNSSFYWWGAWLSSKFYKNNNQTIYAADNFVNKDALPKSWYKF